MPDCVSGESILSVEQPTSGRLRFGDPKAQRREAGHAHTGPDEQLASESGYRCVGLVLSLVATTTVMSVQDRIKEYAVLQTLGVRPFRIMRLVILESTLLCTVGGVLGTVVASVALWMGGFAIGAEGATIAFRPSFDLILLGATVSGLVGIIAGLAPAIQAATVPIVTALRNE